MSALPPKADIDRQLLYVSWAEYLRVLPTEIQQLSCRPEFIMVMRQSEKFDPYINMPSARSLLAISLAPLQAASTLGKSSSCSGRVVVLSENSTLYFGMMNIQRTHG